MKLKPWQNAAVYALVFAGALFVCSIAVPMALIAMSEVLGLSAVICFAFLLAAILGGIVGWIYSHD